MTSLRSEDWSVRPSFVPNGPTSPVVLLADDTGLTQLAGIPPVAWQTPWSELSNLELLRLPHQMALFATVGGVRYCWRHRQLNDYEAVKAMVLEHGGVLTQRKRRVGVYVVVAVVVLASFAGGIASWLNRSAHARSELTDAKSINVTLKDLPPATWYPASDSVINFLVSPPGDVYKFSNTTTTTAPPKGSSFDIAAQVFQSCLGVTNAHDRLYGTAGQEPDYQVSSSVFNTNSLGGVELASSSQYYHTTSMVKKDTREMSMKNFGLCFTDSNAALILAGLGNKEPATPGATNWKPVTFAKGWTRGGEVAITIPSIPKKLSLVVAVITHGHYEITLNAIVGNFAKSKSLLNGLVNTMLSRTMSSSATSA